jgi:hypothetical protein
VAALGSHQCVPKCEPYRYKGTKTSIQVRPQKYFNILRSSASSYSQENPTNIPSSTILPPVNMRVTLLTLAVTATSASAQLCPDANGLYYKGRSGYYQVQCGVEYWTKTNLDSASASSAVACASWVLPLFT